MQRKWKPKNTNINIKKFSKTNLIKNIMSYIESIIWYATLPILIFIVYRLSLYALKKLGL